MPLPNPGMSFSALDPLPAASLNDIVENVEALADGSGLDDDAIVASKIDWASTGAGGGIWWEELGRTTLSGAGDTISVTSIPARKYLKILISTIATGGTLNHLLRFNNDTGNNYAYRGSGNNAADGTVASTGGIQLNVTTGAYPSFAVIEVINISAQEKLTWNRLTEQNTAGAGNLPSRQDGAGKWANTGSQITRVDIVNGGTGDYAIGSEVVVLGHN